MIEPSRWKEISRRTLTVEEATAYIEGNTYSSPGRSFDTATLTHVTKTRKNCIQIIYERVPYDPYRKE